jgi:ribosomal protein S27E
LFYQVVEEYWPEFQAELTYHGKNLPAYVIKEFDEYLRCGRLEHGFLRVRCESCHDEKLVAFSCKRRGFCPSCGARKMADSAALLVDEVLPHQPMRQWVSSSAGEAAGFSLHAGVAIRANERAKLERLCRYITRPAVSTKRLSLTRNGQIRYELKTPWRNVSL